ncbi:MAG: exodeoxyribonuclease VII small subunit [Anaerolineales bacterium]
MSKQTNENQLSFEQALAELEALVAKLEEGELPLDESLALFERGQTLSQRCNDLLDAAELKVRQLAPDSGALDDFEPD